MPPSDRILTFDEYAAIRHATPYVVDVRRDGTRLVLFGGWHSSDPALPMFDQIENAFVRLAPELALHEGTPPHPEPDREIAIRRYGEAGLVTHLAARAGIATASMDIPLAEEARLLRRELPQGDALVFLVVRQLASYNRKTTRMNFDGYFGDFFELIAPSLGLAAIDWPLIEREHVRVMGHPLAAGRVTGHETNPMRDEHMLRRLLAASSDHRRVFAVVGVTHAVMLEPALRAPDAPGDRA
jgi:hypothetical protein